MENPSDVLQKQRVYHIPTDTISTNHGNLCLPEGTVSVCRLPLQQPHRPPQAPRGGCPPWGTVNHNLVFGGTDLLRYAQSL